MGMLNNMRIRCRFNEKHIQDWLTVDKNSSSGREKSRDSMTKLSQGCDDVDANAPA